jgi:hypothetical protein
VAKLDGIESTPNPFSNVRIADRNQPRQDKPSAAGAYERFGDGPDCPVAGQEDPATSKSRWVSADGLDQAGNQRVGEAAMCGDRIYERRASEPALK